MSFLHLGLLTAGVSAVVIPIVIHWLFRQRRKPVEWGAMRFLLEAFQRARQRMRMEQWLLLLIRCAVVGLFALALGRLLLSGGIGGAGGVFGSGGGGRVIYLVIDNGVTAGVVADTAELLTGLDRHKRKASEVLGALHASDRVALVTLARPTEILIDPPALDHAAVGVVLDAIELTEGATEFESGFERLGESIGALEDNGDPVLVYLFSDFYRGAANLGISMPALLGGIDRAVFLYASAPASAEVENVQLAGVTPIRSMLMKQATDGSGQVRLQLRRVGDTSRVGITPIRLATLSGTGGGSWVGDDGGEAVTVVNWEAGQVEASAEFMVPFESMNSGTLGLRVWIGSDALAADNVRYVTVEVRESLRVGVVDRRAYGGGGDLQNLSAGGWFERALDPGVGSRIVVEGVDPAVIEPATLHSLDALFVCQPDLVTDSGWESIADFVRVGGLLWLVPTVDQSVALWTDRAGAALGLPWVWAREVVELSGGEDGDVGVFLAEDQPDSALLGMLRSERSALVQPIEVLRYLPIVEGVQPGGVVLRMSARDIDEAIDDDDDVDEVGVRGDFSAWMVSHSSPDGGGLVVYLASPPHLSWTSLPAKPMMVALVQETLRQGLSLGYGGGRLVPGDRPSLQVPDSATVLARLGDGGREESAELMIIRNDGVARATKAFREGGLYGAMDGRGGVTAMLAVNVEASAAVVEVQAAEDVLAWLRRTGDWSWIAEDDLLAGVREETARAEVSLVLLVVVFLLAILETVLARRFSHAYQSAGNLRVGTSVQALSGTLESAATTKGGGLR